jgi:hypothetical protein
MKPIVSVVLGVSLGYLLFGLYKAEASFFALSYGAETPMSAKLLPHVGLAIPGALLASIALAFTRVSRWLLYSVLAWPVGSYAYSTFVLRVLDVSEDQQVALWHWRGVFALDAFFIYSVFFIAVYLTIAIAKPRAR